MANGTYPPKNAALQAISLYDPIAARLPIQPVPLLACAAGGPNVEGGADEVCNPDAWRYGGSRF